MNCQACGKRIDPSVSSVFGRADSPYGMVLCSCGAANQVQKIEVEKKPASDLDVGKLLGSRMEDR